MLVQTSFRNIYKKMAKETVPCSLCGSGHFAQMSDTDRYGMGLVTVIFRNCGFMFTNPRPTQDEMNHFYKQDYRRIYQIADPRKEYKEKLHWLKREWLYSFLDPEIRKHDMHAPRILDVGCGSGVLLNVIRLKLPESRLYGIEPNEEFAAFAKKIGQATIYGQDIDSFIKEQKSLKGFFDVIVMNHVLEHLYDPVDKLLGLREFLKPGGLILIQVPNFWSPHWRQTILKFHIAHVNQFNPSTIKSTLLLSGFKIIKGTAISYPVHLTAMTYLGRRADTVLARKDMPKLKDEEFEVMYTSVLEKVRKEKVARSLVAQTFSSLKEEGAVATFWKVTAFVKRFITRSVFKKRNISFEKFTRDKTNPQHYKRDRLLSDLIKGEKVLIIGSGPSAQELSEIPDGVKVFTCNAGLRWFDEKNVKRSPDVFLSRKNAMRRNYPDIVSLLARMKTKIFIIDDRDYIQGIEALASSYDHLIEDDCRDNFYLKRLLKPYGIRHIKGNSDVPWTSTGVRLLQYALFLKAKEIYLIGIDFGEKDYFWRSKGLKGHWWRHEDIDENFVKAMSKAYSHIYSASKTSPATRYISYKPLSRDNDSLASLKEMPEDRRKNSHRLIERHKHANKYRWKDVLFKKDIRWLLKTGSRDILKYLTLRKLIRNQKILIIGSGPSAKELSRIPAGVRVFTCNAGIKLLVNGTFKKDIDLYYYHKILGKFKAQGIGELIKETNVHTFITNDLRHIENGKDLNPFYKRIFVDYNRNNFYLKKLVKPYKPEDLMTNEVGWTSAGVRLLQYALYFGAKEIYVIGMDLNDQYFWGEKNVRRQEQAAFDENFIQAISGKYAPVYSLSKTSPITKYFPYRSVE